MLSAIDGLPAICGNSANDHDDLNDPRCGANWEESRTIRASVIHWLCTHADSFGRVSTSAIHLYGAKISGILDFSYQIIPCPLRFYRCYFTDELRLRNAKAPSLILTGSGTRDIRADGIDVANNILLNGGFHSIGEVLFRDAKIGAGFRTEDATFDNGVGAGSGNSLGCDRMKVNGSVFLSKPGHSSTFIGEVGLGGAFIGSNLECDGSRFKNPIGIAIRADGITVVGSVYLRNQFSARGAVRFVNARINVLDCSDGTFECACDAAFSARGTTISGYAVFQRTVISGEASLSLITAGNLTFRACMLTAVDLRYATVRRALCMKHLEDGQCSVWDLRNSSVDCIDDDRVSWPNAGKIRLDGFRYERFGSVIAEATENPSDCPTDLSSRLHWIKLDTFNPPQSYKQLAAVYFNMGETLSSRETLFRLEELLHRNRLKQAESFFVRCLQWTWSQLLKWTVGYGYRLWNSFWWLVLVGVVGYVVSYTGYRYKVIRPTEKDACTYFLQNGRAPNYYPQFSASIFTIEHSVPAINLGGLSSSWSADGLAQISGHPHFANVVRFWLYVQRVLGWALSIFFLAGITGLVKSDK